jgi:hypothetical protein
MSTAVARRQTESTKIGRPLKVLIPLIKADIERGDRAGMEYYADAGDKLLEAKPQVAYGNWGTWLSKNFHRSRTQAFQYMRLAELRRKQHLFGGSEQLPRSLNELEGGTVRARERRTHERPFRAVLQDLDTDFYTQEKQTRDEEVRLHREMALELVDIGYKALATRLHPDRGGSKDAMSRLNRVREELKRIAETRRFV